MAQETTQIVATSTFGVMLPVEAVEGGVQDDHTTDQRMSNVRLNATVSFRFVFYIESDNVPVTAPGPLRPNRKCPLHHCSPCKTSSLNLGDFPQTADGRTGGSGSRSAVESLLAQLSPSVCWQCPRTKQCRHLQQSSSCRNGTPRCRPSGA